MKTRLLIITSILWFSVTSFSQTSDKATMYNKGKMFVLGQDTTKTILFIGGDFIAASDTVNHTITCDIKQQTSKILLTGDFRNNVSNGTVFTRADSPAEEGLFEFRSDEGQSIRTDATVYTKIPSKRSCYIDFPHLKITNSKHVVVASEIGMKTKNINLAEGWLILNSRRTNLNDFPESTDPSRLDTLINTRTNMAHLFVDGKVAYQKWNDPDINKRGFIEVNLALDPLNTAFDYKSLVAFGSPYDSIRSDYFMYNFLVAPSNAGFLGDTGTTIVDPNYTLQTGRGHVLGVDLRGSNKNYYLDYNPSYPNIDFDHRATDKYVFNRFRYANDATRNKNQIFGTNQSVSAYQMEKLTTGDVKVKLKVGFNYLANPYMAPLDVSELLGLDMAGDWGVLAYNNGKPDNERQVVNRVWVLNGDASARSHVEGGLQVQFNFKYYIAKSIGGTFMDEDGRVTIPPLQMFLVYATQPCEITIPASKRTMGNSFFIRKDEEDRLDDFVFEILDETTKTSDRVSVVLRTEDELSSNKECEDVALLKYANSEGEAKKRSAMDNGDVLQTVSSQIYTRNDIDGKPLSVKFLPIKPISSTPLYLTPSLVSQKVVMRGLRLNSMSEIKEIWLEDKFKGTQTLLTQGTLYSTTINSADKTDRFILHFKTQSGVGIGDETEKDQDITAYYSDEILTVSGFMPSDYGSIIYIYDINGRLLNTAEIDNNEVKIKGYLVSGAYLMKVSGARMYNTKFLVK